MPALIKSRPLTTSIQTGIVTHDRDLVEARRFQLAQTQFDSLNLPRRERLPGRSTTRGRFVGITNETVVGFGTVLLT